MSCAAARACRASLSGSGPNTLWVPSSIHTSPSVPVAQLRSPMRAASTALKIAERAADSRIERWSRFTRWPANMRCAAATLSPSRPKRCSPK